MPNTALSLNVLSKSSTRLEIVHEIVRSANYLIRIKVLGDLPAGNIVPPYRWHKSVVQEVIFF